jgi:chromosomal replication initiator protein
LKNILYRDGVEIPEEIIECSTHIKSNVRELGAIISLIAQSSFNKKKELPLN